jgi:hypothetical protein
MKNKRRRTLRIWRREVMRKKRQRSRLKRCREKMK